MAKLVNVIQQIIKNDPFLTKGMSNGLLNKTAVARAIKNEVEDNMKTNITESAIVMAMNRMDYDINFEYDIKKYTIQLNTFKVLKNIYIISFKNNNECDEFKKNNQRKINCIHTIIENGNIILIYQENSIDKSTNENLLLINASFSSDINNNELNAVLNKIIQNNIKIYYIWNGEHELNIVTDMDGSEAITSLYKSNVYYI